MTTILFIKPANYSFANNDQKILEKHFRVKTFLIGRKNAGFHFIWRIANLVVFILINAPRARVMVTWFADYHAAVMVFLGKIFNCKVVIIAGGQEAVCYPELKKGVYYKKFRAFFVKYALRRAGLILPNHQSLVYHENFYYDPSGKKDGMKHYIPDLKTKIIVLPNGIETDKFFRDPSIPKDPNTILTVGTMNGTNDFINKGFDLFIELASRNPDLNFILIGIKKQFLPWIEEHHPWKELKNLKVIFSFCPHEVLFHSYNEAGVFVQASITEGMPNTLCEAMLCECIPVGSNVNGIPDAMGDTGIIVMKRDIAELESAVRKAVKLSSGPAARKWITGHFSYADREKNLIRILQEEFRIKL
ncbi:MAG: glycosyltransferase family 4 protein [Bacteroidetes bacterium]|nr:glycosyltransferase family 4 protein [Bacteroidota bacterium]